LNYARHRKGKDKMPTDAEITIQGRRDATLEPAERSPKEHERSEDHVRRIVGW